MSLSITMISLLLIGCGKGNNDSGLAEDKNVVYGEVSEIDSGMVTIKVGTQIAMEKPDEGSKRDGSTSSEFESMSRPSMLKMTGEEKEIKITENTIMVKQPMGRDFGEKMEPPEAPSGNDQGTPPEIPSGEHQGNSPEIPSEDHQGEIKKEFSQNKDMKQSETEMITINDISKGDIVKITLDDNGEAKQITVISPEDRKQPDSGQQDQ